MRGFWSSFWDTWKLAAFEPARFYPAVGETQDTASAVFFYLIAGMAALIVISPLRFFFSMLFSPLRMIFTPETLPRFGVFGPFILVSSFLFKLFMLIVSPLFLYLFLYFMAGLTHFFLRMVGGASRGFPATLAAFAYASAPNIIPFIGWIWSGALVVIGLAQAHRTETWRPALALTLECLFCSLLLLIPVFMIAAALVRAFSSPESAL